MADTTTTVDTQDSTDTDPATSASETTSIQRKDGQIVITKTDEAGHHKTVTISSPDTVPFFSAHREHSGLPAWVAVIAIVMIASIIKTAIRSKNGDERRWMWGRWGNMARPDPEAERKIDLLAGENERLRGQVSRLEERVAVLERIVTDPAKRIEAEIEALR